MRKYRNECVGCPSEMGCMGNRCPYMNVPIDICENCGDENAEYKIDEKDLCEDCAKYLIQEAFDELTLSEKAEAVEIDLKKIND